MKCTSCIPTFLPHPPANQRRAQQRQQQHADRSHQHDHVAAHRIGIWQEASTIASTVPQAMQNSIQPKGATQFGIISIP